jgi:hypothetical protein
MAFVLPERKKRKSSLVLPERGVPFVKQVEKEDPLRTFKFPEFLGGGEYTSSTTPRVLPDKLKREIRGGTFAETEKEVDHIVSKAIGGTDSPFNLQALKSDRTVWQKLKGERHVNYFLGRRYR